MTKKLNTKRAFGSLFTSIVIHLLIFIVLGFIFLRGKPYEEYIAVNFTPPSPEPKRKLQSKKRITKLAKATSPHLENVVREVIPKITTAAKIDGYNDMALSLSPSEETRTPTMAAPKIHRITIPKAQVQSKTEVPFTKPKSSQNPQMSITSFPIISTELKLPSSFDISEKIDIDVNAIKKYREAIKRKIEEEKKYPSLAEKNGYEGKVTIRFELEVSGQVDKVEVLKSSGHKMLDKEAVRAVTNAVPYPSMPKSIKRKYIIIEVPIVFRLR